jgi:hypothetical protein
MILVPVLTSLIRIKSTLLKIPDDFLSSSESVLNELSTTTAPSTGVRSTGTILLPTFAEHRHRCVGAASEVVASILEDYRFIHRT